METKEATSEENLSATRPSSNDDELKALLKKNLETTEEILAIIKKIRGYWLWQRVYFFIKLGLIAIPIILGIMYLPPLLEELGGQLQQTKDALQGVNETGEKINNINQDIISGFEGILKR